MELGFLFSRFLDHGIPLFEGLNRTTKRADEPRTRAGQMLPPIGSRMGLEASRLRAVRIVSGWSRTSCSIASCLTWNVDWPCFEQGAEDVWDQEHLRAVSDRMYASQNSSKNRLGFFELTPLQLMKQLNKGVLDSMKHHNLNKVSSNNWGMTNLSFIGFEFC